MGKARGSQLAVLLTLLGGLLAAVAAEAHAVLQTPAPGTVLAGATVMFTWSAGSGVAQYWLTVGSSVGGQDLYSQAQGTSLSHTVSGLPTDGRVLYVRLYSFINGAWPFNDYTYVA